jgi:hypothetical protein
MSKKEKPYLVTTGVPGWLQPHKQDRGPVHTEETLEFVITKVSEGYTLEALVRDNPSLPPVGYLRRWILKDPKLKQLYYEAQEMGTDKMVGEMIDIADGEGENGEVMEDVQRSQLRVNIRRWIIEKWNKERYGPEKKDVTVNINLDRAMERGMNKVKEVQGVVLTEEGVVVNE